MNGEITKRLSKALLLGTAIGCGALGGTMLSLAALSVRHAICDTSRQPPASLAGSFTASRPTWHIGRIARLGLPEARERHGGENRFVLPR
jgi:hypothetical protein